MTTAPSAGTTLRGPHPVSDDNEQTTPPTTPEPAPATPSPVVGSPEFWRQWEAGTYQAPPRPVVVGSPEYWRQRELGIYQAPPRPIVPGSPEYWAERQRQQDAEQERTTRHGR